VHKALEDFQSFLHDPQVLDQQNYMYTLDDQVQQQRDHDEVGLLELLIENLIHQCIGFDARRNKSSEKKKL
jgi:hypothetical protein